MFVSVAMHPSNHARREMNRVSVPSCCSRSTGPRSRASTAKGSRPGRHVRDGDPELGALGRDAPRRAPVRACATRPSSASSPRRPCPTGASTAASSRTPSTSANRHAARASGRFCSGPDRLDRAGGDLDDPERHLPGERREPRPARAGRLRVVAGANGSAGCTASGGTCCSSNGEAGWSSNELLAGLR